MTSESRRRLRRGAAVDADPLGEFARFVFAEEWPMRRIELSDGELVIRHECMSRSMDASGGMASGFI